MPNLQPLKFKRVASDGTDLADLGEWVPMEYAPVPMEKELVAFFVHEALLNMREPR